MDSRPKAKTVGVLNRNSGKSRKLENAYVIFDTTNRNLPNKERNKKIFGKGVGGGGGVIKFRWHAGRRIAWTFLSGGSTLRSGLRTWQAGQSAWTSCR